MPDPLEVNLILESDMPVEENGPPTSSGFGPRESADETRQAQQGVVNDAPVDVNVNAVVARSQVLTTDVLGKNFESNADRRNKIADMVMGEIMKPG
jgi:predicted secreted protein